MTDSALRLTVSVILCMPPGSGNPNDFAWKAKDSDGGILWIDFRPCMIKYLERYPESTCEDRYRCRTPALPARHGAVGKRIHDPFAVGSERARCISRSGRRSRARLCQFHRLSGAGKAD